METAVVGAVQLGAKNLFAVIHFDKNLEKCFGRHRVTLEYLMKKENFDNVTNPEQKILS